MSPSGRNLPLLSVSELGFDPPHKRSMGEGVECEACPDETEADEMYAGEGLSEHNHAEKKLQCGGKVLGEADR